MTRRIKSLTAVCLSLMYGLVGLTGESLHYLAQDLDLQFVHAQDLADTGYFHVHGHHHEHVHFHRHIEPAAKPKVAKNSSPDENRVDHFQEFHLEHNCPLLTLVSQFKLGYASKLPIEIEGNFNFSYLHGYLESLSVKPVRAIHVRGPPVLS